MLKLASGVRFTLSPSQWMILYNDYSTAMSLLKVGLNVKFGWSRRFPWILAGLASFDLADSRSFGQKAIAQYDSIS